MKPIFEASHISRIINCPGSYESEKLYTPTERSRAEQEGIAAHWLVSMLLSGGIEYGILSNWLDKTTPNGEIITQEMIDGADLFYNEVCRIPINKKFWLVEHQLMLQKAFYTLIGRPDCAIYTHDTLYIFEYKFGHRSIEAVDNLQLVAYMHLLGQNIKKVKKIVANIIQPRCFSGPKIKTWEINFALEAVEIFEKFEEGLERAAKFNTNFQVSNECYFCAAKHVCGTLQHAALSALDLSGENSPQILDGGELGNELRILEHARKILDTRINGLSEQALAYLRQGKYVSHYHAEPIIGHQRWSKPYEEILQLGELFNVDLEKPPELISPAQALKKGLPEEIVKINTKRPIGAMKLVKDDSSKTNKIFNQLNQE